VDEGIRLAEYMASNQRFRTSPWHTSTCVFPLAELFKYNRNVNTAASHSTTKCRQQEAQLSQKRRATLRVVENVARRKRHLEI